VSAPDGAAEEIEQHERKGGKARAIRRSLVLRLGPPRPRCHAAAGSGGGGGGGGGGGSEEDLLGIILSALPASLGVGVGAEGGGGGVHEFEDASLGGGGVIHEFEDASLVLYRERGRDWYAQHHDSWSPG